MKQCSVNLEHLFFSFAAIFVSALALAGGRGYLVLGIAAVVALIFAVLSAVFGDPMIIPVMGIGGGVLGGLVASRYVPYDSTIVFYAASAVLAVLGICIQYAVKSRKIAKMERRKVKEIGKRNQWNPRLRWREMYWILMKENRQRSKTRRDLAEIIRKLEKVLLYF